METVLLVWSGSGEGEPMHSETSGKRMSSTAARYLASHCLWLLVSSASLRRDQSSKQEKVRGTGGDGSGLLSASHLDTDCGFLATFILGTADSCVEVAKEEVWS